MKKLLLAVAVSTVAAGSVNAATVYEKDGFTYKLNGDFQVQLRQKHGDDKNAHIEFDDLELKNYVSYDLGNDMKAFGRVDFGFKDAAEDKQSGSDLEEAYVGLQYGIASFSFGKQNFASDEFGIEEAIEAPLDEDRYDALGTDGDDTLRIDVELDNVYVAASYEMEAEGEDSENGEYFDVFASTEVAGLVLAAAFQEYTPAVGSVDVDESIGTWGISAAYDFGFMGLAADYSVSDRYIDEVDGGPDVNVDEEYTLYNVAATFDVASTTGVAIGMQNGEPENGEDVTAWYANVTYKFPTAKNVSVFAEIADTDKDDVDMGYLAGMRVKF